MKKNKLKLSVFVLLIFGLSNIQAQEAIPVSGGEASGGGGSASYTVGQVVYITETGTNGNSVAQGVQQPFEISVVSGIEQAKDINLICSAYPNPTTDYLILKVENFELSTLNFQLYDINGKLLQTVKATGTETQIETNNLIPANYFLKVYAVGKNNRTGILDKQKEIKVFKIIKN